MKTEVYLHDAPELRDLFQPFSHSRPLGELRYGAFLIRERWSAALGRPVAGHLGAGHLADFAEPGSPPVVSRPGEPNVARLVFLSSFVPAHELPVPAQITDPLRFVDERGALVGLAIPRRVEWPGWPAPDSWPAVLLPGKRLAGVWDLIGDLPLVLADDLERLRAEHGETIIPRGVTVLGDPALVIECSS